MADNALASARMAHGANVVQIDLADKLIAEWLSAGRVEGIPDIEMMLEELCARQRTSVEDRIVPRVDAVRANRDDDVALASESFCRVIVSLVAWDRLPGRSARPLEGVDLAQKAS